MKQKVNMIKIGVKYLKINNQTLNKNSPIYGTRFSLTRFLSIIKATNIEIAIPPSGIKIAEVIKSNQSNRFLFAKVRYELNSSDIDKIAIIPKLYAISETVFVAFFLENPLLSIKYITAGSIIETADVIAANAKATKKNSAKTIPALPIS